MEIEESEVQVDPVDDELPSLTELQYSNFAKELPTSNIEAPPVDAISKFEETSTLNDDNVEFCKGRWNDNPANDAFMNGNDVASWGILHEIVLPLIHTVLSVFVRRNESLTDHPEIEKNVPDMFTTWLPDDGTGKRYAVSGEEKRVAAKVMFCRSF